METLDDSKTVCHMIICAEAHIKGIKMADSQEVSVTAEGVAYENAGMDQ